MYTYFLLQTASSVTCNLSSWFYQVWTNEILAKTAKDCYELGELDSDKNLKLTFTATCYMYVTYR